VKAGDVIEGNYRVEGVVGSRLGLIFLPLEFKQTLEIGNDSTAAPPSPSGPPVPPGAVDEDRL
jgi:hypothetical protein